MSPRPLAVTVLCVLGALLAVIAALILSVNALWVVPPSAGQRALALGAVAVTATALYGMWRMKRWSVVLAAAMLLGGVVYGLAAQRSWSLPTLAGPAVLLLVGLIYRRQMT
jgi:hypothetical protein